MEDCVWSLEIEGRHGGQSVGPKVSLEHGGQSAEPTGGSLEPGNGVWSLENQACGMERVWI